MHKIPTSAFSSASSTGSGAPTIGRGPKSSSNSPVIFAPRSCSARSRLAATSRLTSSAISATRSFALTPRHTSTAFFAPGISSFGAVPKDILTILPELAPAPILPCRKVTQIPIIFPSEESHSHPTSHNGTSWTAKAEGSKQWHYSSFRMRLSSQLTRLMCQSSIDACMRTVLSLWAHADGTRRRLESL